jgi:hypothetical protein
VGSGAPPQCRRGQSLRKDHHANREQICPGGCCAPGGCFPVRRGEGRRRGHPGQRRRERCPGWNITRSLSDLWDYKPGKTYRLFIRVRGRPSAGAKDREGDALEIGLHVVAGGQRPDLKIAASQMDGNWHVAEIATWKNAPAGGGTFYVRLDRANAKNFVDKDASGADAPCVFFDSVWLQEVADAPAGE